MSFSNIHQLKSEETRLQTFEHWPLASAIKPEQLAKTGFYYIGPSDRVKCVFCNGILKSWLPNDDPATEHRFHFPHCPFLQGKDVGNVPMATEQVARPRSLVMESVRFPAYAEIGSRLNSLSRLPEGVLQNRQVMAEAGFFYTGHGDSVKCYSCGGALRNWQADDDPWIEHARWFPRCPYLRHQKGDEFVDDIESNFRNASVPTTPHRENPPSAERHHEELSPMIQAVMESGGYSEDVVQRVLLNLKRIRGPSFQVDVETLMEAVMSEQEKAAVSESTSPAGTTASTSGSHLPSEERIICKICMEREVEVTFQPCGHLVCCEECAHQLRECPVCRTRIRSTVRTYLA
ncbi:baculoviral IAP repeat-containing protein 7-like isoform X2 [Haliotis asinina]|uniref:baculoviral IAP repeat-containing protein 7-like isoform X2 n=1 Tax=Haliotis asinina TaxID=109174 RepID=UPI003531A3BF